ncbi:MAG: hypothetical protein KatS3mg038_2508 [Candidatus Kapaibacterium sp.]|nr:MAG: hypothetical protein KatS3mg038_2508 [Candidatus Kapabacteria bacterium]
MHAAPLLEEKRHLCFSTLFSDRAYPFRVHRARSRARLPTNNYPVYAFQWQIIQRSDKRLTGQKSHGGGHGAQVVDPMYNPCILDTDAHPYIGWPLEFGRKFSQSRTAFGENLEDVLRAIVHCGKNALNEVQGYKLVEQVAHRVDEDPAWLAPAFRQIDQIRMERNLKAVTISVCSHRLQSLGEALGIAMLAPLANLCAASYRVPGRIRPLDV